MKVTQEARGAVILNNSTTGGNPVLPNPDAEPVDPVDVALDAEATVPITPAASIAIVQSVTATDQLSDVTCSLTDPPTPGNVLVAIMTSRSTPTPTGPDGWTAHPDGIVAATGVTSYKTGLWWKIVEVGESQTVVGGVSGSTRSAMTVIEIEGAANLVDSASLGDQNGDALALSVTPGANPTIIIGGFGVRVSDPGGASVTPDADTTEIADEKVSSTFAPLHFIGYRIVPSPSGAYTVGGTVSQSSRDWAGEAIAFDDDAGEPVWIAAPLVVDGDDATYNESTEADGLHIDLGGPNALDSVRLLIGSETSGSKSYDLYGANESDYSDEVLVVAKTFTATGSFTPDEVMYDVTTSTAYRYLRFAGPFETRRWFTVEMFAAPDVIEIPGYQLLSEKGEPDGYVPLDEDGLIPTEFLPAGSGVIGARFPIGFVVDGGGVAITADVQMEVPIIANGTLVSWVMSADQPGDAVVDVWLDDGASYPPTDADSITGGNEPELSGDDYATGTVSGWAPTLTVGDVLVFHLDSAATIERLELTLIYERT